jgi:hypothetical protein
MATAHNGQHRDLDRPSRTMRFDRSGLGVGQSEPGPVQPGARVMAEKSLGHSGRRFVVVAVAVVLLTWGGLYLAFQSWRARYRERVAYGATHVVAVIDPLKAVTPPDVEPAAWLDAVDETRAMLTTVVGSNLLDRDEMNRLGAELDHSVARASAHPQSAKTELAGIWNNLADRAEFLFQDSRSPTLDRHPRPKILPARPGKPKLDTNSRDFLKQ